MLDELPHVWSVHVSAMFFVERCSTGYSVDMTGHPDCCKVSSSETGNTSRTNFGSGGSSSSRPTCPAVPAAVTTASLAATSVPSRWLGVLLPHFKPT